MILKISLPSVMFLSVLGMQITQIYFLTFIFILCYYYYDHSCTVLPSIPLLHPLCRVFPKSFHNLRVDFDFPIQFHTDYQERVQKRKFFSYCRLYKRSKFSIPLILDFQLMFEFQCFDYPLFRPYVLAQHIEISDYTRKVMKVADRLVVSHRTFKIFMQL